MSENAAVAKYLRISKDDGRYGESQSIENQRSVIDDYINAHEDLRSARIVEFIDDGHTGLDFRRDGFQDMLEQAKRGLIQAILTKDYSRLGRQYIDVGDYMEQIFPFLGVRFVAVNEGYDSAINGSIAGDVTSGFKNIYNNYYSVDLSRKVKAGLRARKESGKYAPSFCPYGFKKAAGGDSEDHGGYIMDVDETAAAVVRRIFDMKIGGKSGAEIARTLNAEGVPSPLAHRKQGGEKMTGYSKSDATFWTGVQIGKMLTDVRYKGDFAYNMYRSKGIGGKASAFLPKDQWETLPGKLPAIVPNEVFDKAQWRKVDYTGRKCGGIGKKPLARKLLCGGCGYALKYDSRAKVHKCGRQALIGGADCCGGGVSEPDIEGIVATAIRKLYDLCADEGSDGKVGGSAHSAAKGYNVGDAGFDLLKELREAEGCVQAAENEKTALYTRYCDGEIDRETFIKLRDAETVVLDEAAAKLAKLKQEQADLSASGSRDKLTERLGGVSFDGTLTKELADALIEKVLVYDGGRVEIVWKFSDPFEIGRLIE